MRTERRGPWRILMGLFIVGAVGCQTLTYVDRSLIPDGGGGQGGESGDGGTDGESDAANQ